MSSAKARDFRKAKAKVGKKVDRGNVTTINLKSRKIQMSAQVIGQDGESNNPRDVLDRLLRVLQHHSVSQRHDGLKALLSFFQKTNGAQFFVPLAMPGILEVMFDGDDGVRSSLLALLSGLFIQYSSESFAPAADIIVTYMSNGLTSLNIAVRKDALTALHSFAQQHAVLLCPHAHHLVERIISLLSSQAKLSRNIDKMTMEKKMELGIGKRGGKGKNCGMNSLGGSKNRDTDEGGKGTRTKEKRMGEGGGKREKPGERKETLSVMMHVVLLLLRAKRNDGAVETRTTGVLAPAEAAMFFVGHHHPRTASFLAGRASKKSEVGRGQSFLDSVKLLCVKLSDIWTGMVDDGAIDVSQLEMAQEVLRVMQELPFHTVLAPGPRAVMEDSFYAMVKPVLRHFPNTLKNADSIATGSAKQSYALKNLETCNHLVSEIALLLPVSGTGTGTANEEWRDEAQRGVSSGLLQILDVHRVRLQESFDSLVASGGEHGLSALAAAKQGVLQVLNVTERTLKVGPALAGPLASYLAGLLPVLEQVFAVLLRRNELPATTSAQIWSHGLAGLVYPSLSLLAVLCKLATSDKDEAGTREPLQRALLAATRVCVAVPDAPVDQLVSGLLLFLGRAAASASAEPSPGLRELSCLIGAMFEPAFFHRRCTDQEKLKVLELWFFLPFESLPDASVTVLKLLCNHEGDAGAPSATRTPTVYFLRLLYERREQFGTAALVQTVLDALDECVAAGARGAGAGQEADLWLRATHDASAVPVLAQLLRRLVGEALSDGDDAVGSLVVTWLSNGFSGPPSPRASYWHCVAACAVGGRSLTYSGLHALDSAAVECTLTHVMALLKGVDVPHTCSGWGRPGLVARLLQPLAALTRYAHGEEDARGGSLLMPRSFFQAVAVTEEQAVTGNADANANATLDANLQSLRLVL